MESYLETYGDTIPTAFKNSLTKRIPSDIGTKTKAKKETLTSQSGISYTVE